MSQNATETFVIFLYVFLFDFSVAVFSLINATCALFHMGNSDWSTAVESLNQFTWVNYGSLYISKPFSEPTLTVLMCNEGILATLRVLSFLHLNKVVAGWTFDLSPQVSYSSVNTDTVDFVSKCKLQRKVGIRTFSFRPTVSFALWLELFAWDDPTEPESCVTRAPRANTGRATVPVAADVLPLFIMGEVFAKRACSFLALVTADILFLAFEQQSGCFWRR